MEPERSGRHPKTSIESQAEWYGLAPAMRMVGQCY